MPEFLDTLRSLRMRATHAKTRLERRLLLLMGARLALSSIVLITALALESAGWDSTPVDWRGFYTTVAVAFLATIGYALIRGRVRNLKRFAAINVATDIALVSAIVYISGGSDSPFAFLYLIVAVYGAVLFERTGAMLSALASVAVYAAALIAERQGWLPGTAIAVRDPVPVVVGTWLIHSGAVVLVAGLSNRLAMQLRNTDQALEQRTYDLSRLQTLHQRTVESLMSGLLTLDPEGRITSFNPEAERITRQRARDVLGGPVEAVLPGVDQLVADSSLDQRPERSRTRTVYRDRDGQQRHLGVAAYVLKDEHGRASGHVVIFQDVTSVVEMEANLRRSERLAAVGELSASIAHEIRNPLAAISGSIEMLQGQRNPPGGVGSKIDGHEQLMAIVLREIDRLNHLITDFLHFARPGPRHLETVRVAEAVEDVLKLVAAAEADRVDARVTIDADLTVVADPAQLRQVLWNLLLNAAQATRDGGSVEVTGRAIAEGPSQGPHGGDRRDVEAVKQAGWVEIAVRDDGVGIPTDVLDRIFDPFFTTKQTGTGLGLATVHRIVEDHGGVVRLESEVGTGTQVRVRFPASEAPA